VCEGIIQTRIHLPSLRASYALANRGDSRATYPAVCSKQVTLRCNADPVNGVVGTEQPDGMLGGQLFGPGGNSTPEYWIDGVIVVSHVPSRWRCFAT
jgi:hypothetical protein